MLRNRHGLGFIALIIGMSGAVVWSAEELAPPSPTGSARVSHCGGCRASRPETIPHTGIQHSHTCRISRGSTD
jgi:hypothetical protein